MQKYAITSLIMATIAIPAMATNDLVTETNNGCDNTTLNTYDGDVNLTADWSANTINLTWYNDSAENGGEVHSNTQCTYNSGITLPTAPTRNGYTFGGWQVRQCSISSYYSDNLNYVDYGYKNKMDANDTFHPYSHNSDKYDLTNGTWAIEFDRGILKGQSVCTNTAPNNFSETFEAWDNEIITDEQLMMILYGTDGTGVLPYDTFDSNTAGGYCWCAGTNFASCHVASPSWIFLLNVDQDPSCPDCCAKNCTRLCAQLINEVDDFRRAVFGVTE